MEVSICPKCHVPHFFNDNAVPKTIHCINGGMQLYPTEWSPAIAACDYIYPGDNNVHWVKLVPCKHVFRMYRGAKEPQCTLCGKKDE